LYFHSEPRFLGLSQGCSYTVADQDSFTRLIPFLNPAF
jgi:hypothetical protein